MKVVKFGGSSVANAEQFRKVGKIVLSDPGRRIMVVSAPGKRYKSDQKITDLLIAWGEKIVSGKDYNEELTMIVGRYQEIAADLGLSLEIIDRITADLLTIIAQYNGNADRLFDRLKASGEDNNAKLMAAYITLLGHEAHYIHPKEAGILVTDDPGKARILPEAYPLIKKLRERQGILVIPGFFGYSAAGNIVTFPRGGSDITGSIVAAGVEADIYENFTDVDSIYCVNPTIVANPKEIKEITYREMRELAYAGFSVFHDEALQPVFRAGITVCIKNTNNPEAPGTLIVSEREYRNGPVVGIASDKGFCSIYVSKYLMNREIGFGRKLLQILEDEGISYEHTPSGIDNMSIILREHQLSEAVECKIMQRFKDELQVDDISIERNLAMVMVVGEGMAHRIGVAARATNAFAESNVNIEMINQGSSEVSMMFGVKADTLERAVQALYHAFFQN